MIFDEVLPTLLRECETWEHERFLRKVAVVRDLRGRLRLAIELDEPGVAHRDALVVRLKNALGEWFTGEVLCARSSKGPLRDVARRVLELAPAWPSPTWQDLGVMRPAKVDRWRLWERRMGKLPWLEGQVAPPWGLSERDPVIVAFYSFKGGVGRTTTLASCALQAARQGESVVVLDLDLEAPGVGSLFNVSTDRGVIDLLVEHLATGATDVASSLRDAGGLPDDLGERIQVIPAGRLDASYLEKLSRLDFSGALTQSEAPRIPVREALVAALSAIRESVAPQWIFLDARAGLHDLAGLSLHGLAHLDVLFSRANAQGIAGLDLVLAALSRRTRDVASHALMVHAMAPASVREAEAEQARMRDEIHAMFVRHGLYTDAIPEQAAPDADHWPWTLPRVEAIERNDRLADILPELSGDHYRAVWERLRLLAGRT